MIERLIPMNTKPEELIPGTTVLFPKESEIDSVRDNPDFVVLPNNLGIHKLPIKNLDK